MKLLRTFFFAIFIFLAGHSIHAQGWGIRGGANFSTLSDSDVKSQTGFYGGLYKQFGIVPKLLYIQPELQFSSQGFETETGSTDLNYIQVPILARLYVLKLFSFETGPQFGFLISDKTSGPINPDYNTFNTSWAFGMSINLPLGLFIDGRYITGLSELTENTSSKNQVIQVGAGIRF
ncbi:MAG: PorT family protein [Flavobacterium sp.]|nr:PorT family protein [Flavobacterium sp.]